MMFRTLKIAAFATAMTATSVVGAMALEYGWSTAGVNFRSGPSTYYEVVGQIEACTKVSINYKENNWYNVSWGNHEGWVSAKYIAYDEPYCGAYEKPSYGHKQSYSY